MGTRHCIIHGHFYQPPRENPWLNVIEVQKSAAPAHDWNERVYDECYRPNASSRILDANGMIVGIYNNYRNLSFNIGPTLLRWLEEKHPVVVEHILAADRESVTRLDGHGNAIAQVYNHIIMPLASRRDQLTQIRWAKAFFKSRFGRDPEGMWLAETAINMETVYCLIEEGIRFIVLSPLQAEGYGQIDKWGNWTATSQQPIDTHRPYRLFAHDRQWRRMQGSVDVFFFDEPLSRAVSFDGVLNNSQTLADRIGFAFGPTVNDDQVVVIATDGETFGHHKAFGDMCLAFFFEKIAAQRGVVPVNFGYYLSRHAPAFEVKLKNMFDTGTAWSCVHGTGRWSRDCGCQTGGKTGWNQKWRTPLRRAMETAQRHVDRAFEEALKPVVDDPWKLRDDFCVVEGTTRYTQIAELLQAYGATEKNALANAQQVTRLLQAQKYMLFAFTSCAWFFSDISGIETVQNLRYAARALQLGLEGQAREEATKAYIAELQTAQSNLKGETGATIFAKQVAAEMRHLEKLSFYAVCSTILAENRTDFITIYGYIIHLSPLPGESRGRDPNRLFLVSIVNQAMGEVAEFAVLLLNDPGRHLSGHLLPAEAISKAGFDKWTPGAWSSHPLCYSLRLIDLFEEMRLQMTSGFVAQIIEDAKCREWLANNIKVLVSLADLNGELPSYLQGPATYALNNQWNHTIALLANEGMEDTVMTNLLEMHKKIEKMKVTIDFSESVAILETRVRDEFGHLALDLTPARCDRIRYMLNIIDRFEIPVSKRQMEDSFFELLTHQITELYENYRRAEVKTSDQKTMLLLLLSFARRMNFNTDRFQFE
jgi:alpha-amylase/alpha-mannosidase (GH57 family)